MKKSTPVRLIVRSVAGLTLLASASPSSAQTNFQLAGESERFRASATAGLRAVHLCNGLFQGGLERELIERNISNPETAFGPLPEELATEIDSQQKTVAIRYLSDMPARIAVWRPVLGCVLLPTGATLESAGLLAQVPASFRPPELDEQPWPIGDRAATMRLPRARQTALDAVVASAFGGDSYGGTTWGVIVVHRGKIVAERYAPGFGIHTASQTHSAAKSFTSTLAGLAIEGGMLDLDRPGVLAEWRAPGDPRGAITLRNLLHMSSGLYGEAASSLFLNIYTQGARVRDLAQTNFLVAKPGSRFVYNPADTMLIMQAIRQSMNDDAAYLRFPYESLFWKIGMTRTTMTGDWDGSIYGSGQTWSTARDFARFGLLYVNDGIWQGKRVLPAGWRDFVASPAPAQPSTPPFYGAQFWLHSGLEGLPEDSFSPHGGRGHYAMIIPSRDTVIVRRGFDETSFKLDRFSADVLAALGR